MAIDRGAKPREPCSSNNGACHGVWIRQFVFGVLQSRQICDTYSDFTMLLVLAPVFSLPPANLVPNPWRIDLFVVDALQILLCHFQSFHLILRFSSSTGQFYLRTVLYSWLLVCSQYCISSFVIGGVVLRLCCRRRPYHVQGRVAGCYCLLSLSAPTYAPNCHG